MSAAKQLKAQARDRAGKGVARAIRRQGRVPAVIYGGNEPAKSISLDGKEITVTIHAGHFLTTIFDIDVDGETIQVIPRNFQLDPVKDSILHVDFLRISQGQEIKVTVPFHIIDQDKCPGVKRGGTIQFVEHSVELYVPTNAIPEHIDVSVAELDFGDTIHLNDIALPEGARPAWNENPTIVTIIGVQEEAAEGAAQAAEASSEPAAETPAKS
ncbi:MAG: 50S ribosomal protein L25/general stress protein Ctc [Methylobacteriaceae bacterium]|jgi:large subunit ribosomal protein L25|nr:50S ribosomal protein L25/general stress protein Ctc [Methylobacteriaceae bacterium]